MAGGHLVVDVAGWFTGAGAAVTTAGLFVPASREHGADALQVGLRLGAPPSVPAHGHRQRQQRQHPEASQGLVELVGGHGASAA